MLESAALPVSGMGCQMTDDPRWPYARIPHFAYPENCPGMNSSRFMTYCAVRSFCYFRTVANPSFNRCTASLATIGKRAGQSIATVKRNLKWLEQHYLIYRTPQGWNKPKCITPVNSPNAFRKACQEAGREQAVIEEEAEREEVQAEKWKENARQAAEHKKECRLTGEPRGFTSEPGGSSPMNECGLTGEPLRTGLKHRFEATVDQARASSDTPPMTSFVETTVSQTPDPNPKPLAKGEPKLIPIPEDVRVKVRELGKGKSWCGRRVFIPVEFDKDEFRRIRAECAAHDRARRSKAEA